MLTSKDVVTFNELLIKSSSSLFQKMQSPEHCLNSLLPPKKTSSTAMAERPRELDQRLQIGRGVNLKLL